MQKMLKVLLWYPSAVLLLFFSILNYQRLSSAKSGSGLIRQELNYVIGQKTPSFTFAAIPKVAFEIKTAIATQDARPIIINKYLERYGSPMQGMGNFITSVADENNVDPYLIIAIAQQESNLGKITPPECHNAWGWGIHSDGTLCFDNWDQGIAEFTRGIRNHYHNFGLYTPNEIMTKYVPHSPEGAWAKGVNQFINNLRLEIGNHILTNNYRMI